MAEARRACRDGGLVKDDSDDGGEGDGLGFDIGMLSEPTVEGIVKRSSSSVVEAYGPIGLVKGLSRDDDGRACVLS